LWDPQVTVGMTKSTYNNERLLVKWVKEELVKVTNGEEILLVIDSVFFHKTPEVKLLIRSL
jgi:hypothetical protein